MQEQPQKGDRICENRPHTIDHFCYSQDLVVVIFKRCSVAPPATIASAWTRLFFGRAIVALHLLSPPQLVLMKYMYNVGTVPFNKNFTFDDRRTIVL